MESNLLAFLSVLAQQDGTAYNAGRIAGLVILIALVAAVLWKLLKSK